LSLSRLSGGEVFRFNQNRWVINTLGVNFDRNHIFKERV